MQYAVCYILFEPILAERMPAELLNSINDFQESLILCRPRDVLSFATRYFNDEKLENFEEAHAIHSLPFLIHNQNQFRNIACTVFCQQITNGSASKDYLDGNTVLETVKNMNLGGIWFDISAIDEVTHIRLQHS